MEIRNKITLVTGSTRGIGRVIGEKLCRLGAVVYFNSHNSRDDGIKLQRELRQNGLKAFYVEGDVSSEKEVRTIFKTIKNEQERLDILVNNAGIYRKDGPDYENYSAIHAVNGYGYFYAIF